MPEARAAPGTGRGPLPDSRRLPQSAAGLEQVGISALIAGALTGDCISREKSTACAGRRVWKHILPKDNAGGIAILNGAFGTCRLARTPMVPAGPWYAGALSGP